MIGYGDVFWAIKTKRLEAGAGNGADLQCADMSIQRISL